VRKHHKLVRRNEKCKPIVKLALTPTFQNLFSSILVHYVPIAQISIKICSQLFVILQTDNGSQKQNQQKQWRKLSAKFRVHVQLKTWNNSLLLDSTATKNVISK